MSSGASVGTAAASAETVTVYKTPTCGCCSAWVEHLRSEGLTVESQDISQRELMELKQEHGVSRDLASCHTALVDGYVIEGHVPAADVQRLLEERPEADGLAVPGMPVGSPGMEQGARSEPYEVVVFAEGGDAGVFARYE
ncbi:MAG: DUF411 domain-containing protein [Ectothiorhodospiraceae bacterium]